MSLRLTEGLEQRLAEEAKIERKPRSELVREALREFLHRREQERFMAAMVAEAKQAYGDPEIRREATAIAEECLPFDNESLDITEGRRPGEPGPEASGEKWWR
ncbi:ribbon-helix-helix domain-containing protein [Candidatus Thiosymbion oneisti]|uniref:ribbon-helix-helix domain-containing protein n=1 Tax=Candidatus Thiosymbion oneisti TaxID=589554 RepID=UPI001FB09FB8|nr:ribbon-helix-helix domain-containing protein [Candidatus Thiosymbion oneisti]